MTVKLKYHYPFEKEINKLILSNISLSRNLRCIDLGCGLSSLHKEFLKKGCEVYRIDKDSDVFDSVNQDSVKYDNLFDINKEISSINPSEIGCFDIIVFSLVSLYNEPRILENIWGKINELSKESSCVFSVDLHPISKFESFPWRANSADELTYWDVKLQDGRLCSDSKETSLKYYHHTFEVLFKTPINYGFTLNQVFEFPKKYKNRILKMPAYLFTKWIK